MEKCRVHLRQISKPEAANCICEKLKMLLKQSSERMGSGKELGCYSSRHSEAEQRQCLMSWKGGRAEGGREAKVCHHLGKLQPSFDALGCGMA